MNTLSPITRRLLTLGLAALAIGLTTWPAHAARLTGSGTAATETRSVAPFQAIALRGAIDLEVRQGDTPTLQVRADDNLLPQLETVVEDGRDGPVLHVRWARGTSVSTRLRPTVSIVVPSLGSIASAGTGKVRIEGVRTPKLKLALTGSGAALLADLQADELAIHIAGSGDVKGSGKSVKLDIRIAGSGDVSLGELPAEDVSVRIAGSGDAQVNAQRALQAKIAGSGDVIYSGDPTLQLSVSGSGSVRKR